MKSRQAFSVGAQQFNISNVSSPFTLDLIGPEIVVSVATPIVVRIPRLRYAQYGISPNAPHEYVFWREAIPFEAFVKQLLDNMAKKWKDYHIENGTYPSNIEEREVLPDVVDYEFIKTVSKPITLKHQSQMVIGSLWNLYLGVVVSSQLEIVKFSIDCGFGERNSLGFGFVNA